MGERSGVAMSCGVGCRRGSDPMLLWLWCRPVATVPISPLAWEPPYAASGALEKTKKKKKKIVQYDHQYMIKCLFKKEILECLLYFGPCA